MRALSVVLVVAFIVLSLSAFSEPQIVTDIKNGDKQLECNFHNGWRTVDSSKIIGIDDISNRWIFSNGSVAMKNCEIY